MGYPVQANAVLVGFLAFDSGLILASVYYIKRLLSHYPDVQVNNRQIILHLLIFAGYLALMIYNLKQPSPVSYLLNVIGQLAAYMYIAVLIFRFAQPLNDDLGLKLLSGTKFETRMALEHLTDQIEIVED